jgi:SAM-dependent methyltransferase
VAPTIDPRARFSGRAADYARARPRYPAALVATLRRAIRLCTDHVIADVGSGTGISAEPFLENGNTVHCIEPNAEMRRIAEQRLASHPRFRSVDGAAEATGLPDATVDVVLAAQAFHWFDRERARREFHRILRSPGWLVLVWNTRRTDGTPFLRAFEDLLRRFGTDYAQVRHDNIRAEEIAGFFGGPHRRCALPNQQVLDLDGLLARVRSASYMPAPGHPRYAPMVAALERLFAAHQQDGRVTIEYETEVFLGRLR